MNIRVSAPSPITTLIRSPELEIAERQVAALLNGHEVNRIFCVPFYPDDALSAIAAEADRSAVSHLHHG